MMVKKSLLLLSSLYSGSFHVVDSQSWVTDLFHCSTVFSLCCLSLTLNKRISITPFYKSPVWLCESKASCTVTHSIVDDGVLLQFIIPTLPHLFPSLPPAAIVLQTSIIKGAESERKEDRKKEGRRTGWDWRLIDWGWLSKGVERWGWWGGWREGETVTSQRRAD